MFLIYLIYAQGISAVDYDFGIAMGTQEPASQITEVGVAFSYGFAFGDAVFYIPLFLAGLIGFAKGTSWGEESPDRCNGHNRVLAGRVPVGGRRGARRSGMEPAEGK